MLEIISHISKLFQCYLDMVLNCTDLLTRQGHLNETLWRTYVDLFLNLADESNGNQVLHFFLNIIFDKYYA